MKTNEALARRWMASKHWGGWRAGMVSAHEDIVTHTLRGSCRWVPMDDSEEPWVSDWCEPDPTTLPDLDHPGTRAFLLEDVRRAWGDSVYWMSGPGGNHVVKCGFQWFNEGKRVGNGLTEAEALIAALEAAPGE